MGIIIFNDSKPCVAYKLVKNLQPAHFTKLKNRFPNKIMQISSLSREPSLDLSQKLDILYVILPESSLKFYWDLVLMGSLLALVFLIPFELAFYSYNQTFSLSLSKFSLSVFSIDLLFNLNTCIYIKGELINRRSLFIKHYLKFWFWIDLVSTIPFELMFEDNIKAQANIGENFNVLKALKLLKLVRLTRFSYIIMKIEDRLTSKKALLFVGLAKIFIYLFMIAHVTGCLMFLVSSQDRSPSSFVSEIENSEGYEASNAAAYSYICCLYWSITTMVAIGYGDLHPLSTSERLTAIIVMNFSSITFGYLLGNIGNIIIKHTAKAKERRETIVNLNKFSKQHKISEDLHRKVLRHANFHFAQSKNKIDFANLVNSLSLPLREEIFSYINGNLVKILPLFSDLDSYCIARISRVLKSQLNSPGDCLIKEKTESNEMFYISRGCVEIVDEVTGSSIKILSNQTYFGEIGFFLNTPRCATIFSISFLETLVLSKKGFLKISDQYPQLQIKLKEVQQLCTNEDLTILSVECYLCKRLGHVAKKCSKLTRKEVNQRKWLSSRRESKIIRDIGDKFKKLKTRDEKSLRVDRVLTNNVWGKKRRVNEIYPYQKGLRKAARRYLSDENMLGANLRSPRLSIFSNDSEVSEYLQNYFNIDGIFSSSESDEEIEEKCRMRSFDTTLLETTKNDQ